MPIGLMNRGRGDDNSGYIDSGTKWSPCITNQRFCNWDGIQYEKEACCYVKSILDVILEQPYLNNGKYYTDKTILVARFLSIM